MEISRAFSVALKIIFVNLIFGIIILAVGANGGIFATIITLIILLPIIMTFVVYFILEEVEDMIASSHSTSSPSTSSSSTSGSSETYNDDMVAAREKALDFIGSDVDKVKFEPVIVKLIAYYRKKGFLRPELCLESEIMDLINSGKTKEQAIMELYQESQKSKY